MNGWTNRETWLVSLWVDNDEGLYRDRLAWGRTAARRATDRDDAVNVIAEQARAWIEDMRPELQGLWSDLMTGALGAVDWREIAEHWVDEVWENPRELE